MSECDRESPIKRRPWPTKGCGAVGVWGELSISPYSGYLSGNAGDYIEKQHKAIIVF